jgi:cytochrome c oxidase subunit I
VSAPRPSKANIGLAVAWFVAAALLLLADAAMQIKAPAVTGPGDYDTYYVVVHRSWSFSLAAAFGLFGALYLGMTSAFPVRLQPALGWPHLAVMSAGAALAKAPQLALALTGLPKSDAGALDTFRLWNEVAAFGYALMGIGLLIFVWALVDGWRRRPSGSS